ncbi:hypothetical protein GJ699_15575 [Duganella sp. FT80W]|uniref:Uncharacterized protein n=1 Tax=Duganella guangzhouensis TaxID=2666084 RepID=A0A6I2KZZ1_9BURK|nr:hypothetical protein [Duganella guangzhouensis]MRW91411.1 hypothetical protein [Duganella guangzhouensis]
MKGKLILAGIEVLKDSKREVRQSWICDLLPPDHARGYRVTDIYSNGSARPRSAIRDMGSNTGDLDRIEAF